MEKKISFISGDLQLEGLYQGKKGEKGVVVTHPHPLYGGEMTNPVVESVAGVYAKKGYSTLRFNFRGVGGSGGSYDDGEGEQGDILAAVDYLLEQGVSSVHLAGYSYGAWVLAKISQFPRAVTGLIFISPPLALLPFAPQLHLPLLQLVVTGEEDEIAPAEMIRQVMPEWNNQASFEVLDFADHFYFGFFKELEEVISRYLKNF